MKFQNTLFPILGMIFIASCSTNPANTNTSGGGGEDSSIRYPSEFSTLPVSINAYVSQLEGSILNRVDDKSLLTDAEHFRSRGFGGAGDSSITIQNRGTSYLAFNNQYTNDHVEDLYIKKDASGNPTSLVKLTAITLNGSYQQNSTTVTRNGQFGEFDTIEYSGLSPVTGNPTVHLSSAADSDPLTETGFTLYEASSLQEAAISDANLANNNIIDLAADLSNWAVGIAIASDFVLLKLSDSQVEWYDVSQTADNRYFIRNDISFKRTFNVRIR